MIIVRRDEQPGTPARVEYALTGRGVSLRPVLAAMWRWGGTRRGQLVGGGRLTGQPAATARIASAIGVSPPTSSRVSPAVAGS
ncbi:winged helix-turn-helix transcriptional regulator [Micromonospora eburnea]|uniref:winged helix-turn-helix transcriptional regulator n=1 Tax=Micromonospora eburnea TaxID=227316 RepID=UPI00363F5E46